MSDFWRFCADCLSFTKRENFCISHPLKLLNIIAVGKGFRVGTARNSSVWISNKCPLSLIFLPRLNSAFLMKPPSAAGGQFNSDVRIADLMTGCMEGIIVQETWKWANSLTRHFFMQSFTFHTDCWKVHKEGFFYLSVCASRPHLGRVGSRWRRL